MEKYTNEELLKELEHRLQKQEKLSMQQNALKNELVIANKKLAESESLKSHFISNITNEIINPFASILGLSKAILSVDKENWKKVLSMVALIYTEAFELDFQLKNIFAAAKIESGEIYPEIADVDVCNIVQSVISTFRIELKKKKIKVDTSYDEEINIAKSNGGFHFKTDPEKFKLILLNLINNAVKYSFEEGQIAIHLWKDGENLFATVRDHGPGISEEHQKIIFDRFKRVDSGITSTNRGHGLGLSINKALLDLLGGEIVIESNPGEGALFTVQFPEATEDSFLTASDDNELFFNDNQVF
jgi:signal transduction histidine kinase